MLHFLVYVCYLGSCSGAMLHIFMKLATKVGATLLAACDGAFS